MKHSSPLSGITRRRFLATTGVALAAPAFVPASALGRADNAAASERITLGVVGWGMQGPGNTEAFLREKDCHVVAVCTLRYTDHRHPVTNNGTRPDRQDH